MSRVIAKCQYIIDTRTKAATLHVSHYKRTALKTNSIGGGSGIFNHESRLEKVKKSEGIMNHIILQAVNHESWTKNK